MATTVESLSLQISSNSKSAISGIDALTQSLAKLKSATKGGLGLSSVSKNLNSVSTSSKKLSISFTDIYHKASMIVRGFSAVGRTIKSLIDKSSEYNEVVNLFTVSMGQYAETAYDYANKVSDIMGIDPSAWMKNQGVFMTLATGFGIAGDRASVMSEQLTQLGYDIASFQNISVEEAMQKLQSGLAGELEPLRRIGYDLSQAKLESVAEDLGIDKTVSDMTQAEKAQLRYYAIMTQVTHQQGDMARTLEDPANQMRILKAQFDITARSIGNIFIPALQAIIPYAIAVTKVIGEMANSIALAFGYEMPEIDSSGAEAMSNATTATGDALDDATDSAKKLKSYMLGFDELNVINSNEDSSENGGLSSAFDFALPTYDFLGGANNDKVEGIIQSIKSFIKEIKGVGNALPAMERLAEFVTTIKEQFGSLDFKIPLFNMLQSQLALMYSWFDLIVPVVTQVIEALNIPQILYEGISLLASWWGTLSQIVTSLTPAILAVVESLTPVVEWIGGAVSDVFVTLGDIIGRVGVLFTNLTPTFTSIGESLGKIIEVVWGLIEPLLSTVWDNTLNFIVQVFDAIVPVITKLMELVDVILKDVSGAFEELAVILEPFAEFIEGALSDVFGEVLAPILEDLCTNILPVLISTVENLWKNVLVPLGELIGAVLTPVIEILSEVLGYIWTYVILPLADALWGILGEAFSGIASILNEVVIPKVEKIISTFKFLWDHVLSPIVNFLWTTLSPVFEEVFKSIGNVIASIKKVFTGLIQFITGIFTGDWKKAWNGIVEMFSGIWDGLKNAVKTPLNFIMAKIEGFINGIIYGWNGLKKAINSLSIDIPDWLGGGTLGFNLKMTDNVTLPRFAEGGFPDQGQMFIAREAGAEMVGSIGRRTAVANNDQIVAGIAGGVAEANEEQNTLLREQNTLLRAILDKNSGVYLDGKSLTNSVENYQRERGRVLISGGVI